MCEQNGNVVPINQHKNTSNQQTLGNLALQDNLKPAINIAIDYDETITKDPKAWDAIMHLMHKSGMKVYVVTYRNNRESFGLEYLMASDFIEKVVFTARNGKKAFCENLGIFIDIWVDDNPITITHTLLGVDANLHYTYSPDNMKCAVSVPAENEKQAKYERDFANSLPITKH